MAAEYTNGNKIEVVVELRTDGAGQWLKENALIEKESLLDAFFWAIISDSDNRYKLPLEPEKGINTINFILKYVPEIINMQDQHGHNALMVTAEYNHLALTEKLLEANASVNLQTIEGWTALMLAAFKGYPDIAEKLLEAGADTGIKNQEGENALIIALYNSKAEAAEKICAFYDDINYSTPEGRSPLMLAAQNGYVEVVKKTFKYWR